MFTFFTFSCCYILSFTFGTYFYFLKEGSPAPTSKFTNCHYTFIWPTSAACPIKELEFKDTCIINDPSTGYSYNLMKLRKTNYYAVASEDDTEFQVCSFCSIFVATFQPGKPKIIFCCSWIYAGLQKIQIAALQVRTMMFPYAWQLSLNHPSLVCFRPWKSSIRLMDSCGLSTPLVRTEIFSL